MQPCVQPQSDRAQLAFFTAAAVFSAFSRSHRSCFKAFSAASAVAPLYFAPLLSCVVDQRTSPSLETSRTTSRASLIVSVAARESAIPAPEATKAPAPVLD